MSRRSPGRYTVVAFVVLACAEQSQPRVSRSSSAATPLDGSRTVSRNTWRRDVDSKWTMRALGNHLMLVPDTGGGVAYAATSEKGLVSGRLGPRGRVYWSRDLPARDDPLALCVMTSGAVAISAGDPGSAGRTLTLLDPNGRTLWVQGSSANHFTAEVLLATEEHFFLVGMYWPSTTLSVTAFDMQGHRGFGWSLPCATASSPYLVDGHLALSLDVTEKCQLPGGPEVSPGRYSVGYDAEGRLLWKREETETPAEPASAAGNELSSVPPPEPAAPSRAGVNCHPSDIMCAIVSAAAKKAAASPKRERLRTPPSVRCASNYSPFTNQNGERLRLLENPRRVRDDDDVYHLVRYRYGFEVNGVELWERDALEDSMNVTVALGEDGSVFEAGVRDANDMAGRMSDTLYVARTW